MDYVQMAEGDRYFEVETEGKKRAFIYDPNLMTLAQISEANSNWKMFEKMIEVLPNTLNEFQLAMKNECLKKGYASLLIEVNPETKQVLNAIFNRNTHSGLEFMDLVKGLDANRRLEDCKANFFLLQGIASFEPIKQLASIINLLKKETGQENLDEVYKLMDAYREGNLEQLPILEKNSTKKAITKKSLGKKKIIK